MRVATLHLRQVPRIRGWTASGVTWVLALTMGLAGSLLAAPHGASRATHSAAPAEARERKAASELKAIQAEIAQITRRVTAAGLEHDRLTRELRTAESAAEEARQALENVQHERAQEQQRARAVAGEEHTRSNDLEAERDHLARQLRAAYMLGRGEPLKLLLNQEDPARAGRLFVYYSYVGKARAAEIAQVEQGVQALAKVRGVLATEDAHLANLEAQQRQRVAALEQARARRSQAVANLEAESRSSEKQLARLKNQQAGLERLLQELRAALDRLPPAAIDTTHSAFAALRGKLTWPVSGSQVLARFGEPRAGGIKWDGMLLSTEAGAPVHAVSQGRVVYADWLPGLGLLSIVDHGDGYMSLYGHNQQLYKAVGEQVKAGDTLAAAGDSGGAQRSELYFEIRKAGKPVDPRPWFRQEHP